jgi:hypothetical protein
MFQPTGSTVFYQFHREAERASYEAELARKTQEAEDRQARRLLMLMTVTVT